MSDVRGCNIADYVVGDKVSRSASKFQKKVMESSFIAGLKGSFRTSALLAAD